MTLQHPSAPLPMDRSTSQGALVDRWMGKLIVEVMMRLSVNTEVTGQRSGHDFWDHLLMSLQHPSGPLPMDRSTSQGAPVDRWMGKLIVEA